MRTERARIRWAAPLLAAAVVACASAGPPPTEGIDPDAVRRDVFWLAAPEREGRGLGSAGLAEAAEHIAAAFEQAGLEPAYAGDYLQRFEVPVAIDVSQAELRVGDRPFVRGVEFEPLLASADGAFAGEVVFAGFGISDEETGWDDYAGLDVAGRTVLVLDGRPGESGDEPLGGGRGAALARPAYKLLNARRNGAAAILLAPASDQVEGMPGVGGHAAAANPTIQDAGIVAGSLSHAAAAALVDAAGRDLGNLARAVASGDGGTATGPLEGARIDGAITVARTRGEVANVVGLRRGHDPALRDEVVVVGAHFDHLGTGAFGSLHPDERGRVHPGADDNASGTAGLLAVARALGSGPPPRRTVMLAAFTAEEAGLLGSAHLVDHPPMPLEQIAAMINLDMIGRLRDDRVVVFGAESGSGFRERVEAHAKALELDPAFEGGAHGPSDQTSFAARGIPVLFFFTGLHPDYHAPSDLPEKVDAVGVARVAALTTRMTRELADAETRPAFLADAGSGHGGAPRDGASPGYGPVLGTVPAFGGEPVEGVRLSGVRAGSPAEAAGLREGDVIVGFAGSTVRNLEEYAALLFSQSPGREVEIVVLRDGQRITTRATLGQRR